MKVPTRFSRLRRDEDLRAAVRLVAGLAVLMAGVWTAWKFGWLDP